MAETDAALLRRWFEVVWNERREDLMEELASPNVVTHGVSGPKDVTRGLGAFRALYRKLRGAFPDVHFTVDEAIGERDVAAVRWTARMTHRMPASYSRGRRLSRTRSAAAGFKLERKPARPRR